MIWQIKTDVYTWNMTFPEEKIRVISEEEYKDAANTLNDRVKKAGHYKGVNAENLRDAVESGDISSEEAKEIYTYLADPSDENYNNMSDEANQAVMDNEILDSGRYELARVLGTNSKSNKYTVTLKPVSSFLW